MKAKLHPVANQIKIKCSPMFLTSLQHLPECQCCHDQYVRQGACFAAIQKQPLVPPTKTLSQQYDE